MPGSVTSSFPFNGSCMAEAVLSQNDRKIFADSRVMVGHRCENCVCLRVSGIQKSVELDADHFTLAVCCSIAVGDRGCFLNRKCGSVGKTDFEIVQEHGALERRTVSSANMNGDDIIVVPFTDLEFAGDVLPFRRGAYADSLQNRIARMIPVRHGLGSAVAQSSKVDMRGDFPDFFR